MSRRQDVTNIRAGLKLSRPIPGPLRGPHHQPQLPPNQGPQPVRRQQRRPHHLPLHRPPPLQHQWLPADHQSHRPGIVFPEGVIDLYSVQWTNTVGFSSPGGDRLVHQQLPCPLRRHPPLAHGPAPASKRWTSVAPTLRRRGNILVSDVLNITRNINIEAGGLTSPRMGPGLPRPPAASISSILDSVVHRSAPAPIPHQRWLHLRPQLPVFRGSGLPL